MNPAKKMQFEAVVANPPFSYRWQPKEEMAEDLLKMYASKEALLNIDELL